MPISVVIPVVLVGWGTACALTCWRGLGGAARVPALVANELPFLGGYLLVISTVDAMAQGRLAASAGGVIVGVAVLVVLLGLQVIVRRALRADAALHNATPARRRGLGSSSRRCPRSVAT